MADEVREGEYIMNKKTEVGPDLMNVFEIIAFNYFFKTELDPCRNTNKEGNIPTRGFLYDLIKFLRPVFFSCYFFPGLIQTLEPKWNIFRLYAA